MIKIYKDISEALKDIEWNGKGKRASYTVALNGRDRAGREKLLAKFFEDFEEWIMKDSRLVQTHGKPCAVKVNNILWELVKNAEYPTPLRKSFEVDAYLGKEGALMGTRQKAKFLSPEEIEMLIEWKEAVHSTKFGKSDQPIGRGTQMFVEEGDGLLILPKQKAIYVAKYFPGVRR